MSLPMRQDDSAVSTNEQAEGVRVGRAPGGRRPWYRRNRMWLRALAVAVVAGAAAAAAVLLTRGSATDDTPEPVVPLATATVEERDIVETTELDATLRFQTPQAVTAGRAGTLTEAAAEGDTVERGDVLFRVDDVPVTLMYGDTPPYRTLQEGATGADVRYLEANLAVLGFDAEGTLAVDGSFDAATATAVEAWQSDLGVAGDGTVEPTDYRVAAGPVQVTATVTSVGLRVAQESTVLQASALSKLDTVVAPAAGTVTDLPEAGTVLTQGQVLLEVAGTPLPVVLSETPFDRDLADGTEGEDVAALERALAALGFDADGELVIDEEYDEATVEAVEAWEEDLGIPVDGVVAPSQVVTVPDGSTVDDVLVEADDEVRAGQPVLELRASTRVVEAELPVDGRVRLAAGDTVEVELPDGSTVPGTVGSVGVVAQTPEGDAEADPFVDVEIEIAAPEEDAEGAILTLTETPVDVLVAGDVAAGVLAVPTSALVALQGGGYAVEVADGGQTRLVAVEPGSFGDGFVEITGDVQAGTTVVVPQ